MGTALSWASHSHGHGHGIGISMGTALALALSLAWVWAFGLVRALPLSQHGNGRCRQVIADDLNPLCTRGVSGPNGMMKVKIFGQTLDLKGREKFLNQVSVQSYVGCSHCHIEFDPPGPRFCSARRYLPIDHPLRRQFAAPYEFTTAELRGIWHGRTLA